MPCKTATLYLAFILYLVSYSILERVGRKLKGRIPFHQQPMARERRAEHQSQIQTYAPPLSPSRVTQTDRRRNKKNCKGVGLMNEKKISPRENKKVNWCFISRRPMCNTCSSLPARRRHITARVERKGKVGEGRDEHFSTTTFLLPP